MIIGDKEYEMITVVKDGEVVAVIDDVHAIEHDSVEVILEEANNFYKEKISEAIPIMEKYFSFFKAIKYFSDGKEIRRQAWDSDTRLKYENDNYNLLKGSSIYTTTSSPYVFTEEDLHAKDWCIYKPNKNDMLCDFRIGDKVVCIINNDDTLAPCEMCKVTGTRGHNFITLEGYGNKTFNKRYFRLFERGEE